MTKHRIQISGLPDSTNEEAVREFFTRVGDVASCTLQGTTAILAFHNADDFHEALNMDGVEFEDGVPIQVTKCADADVDADVDAEDAEEKDKTSDAPAQHENGADADTPTDAATAAARENRKRFPEHFKIAIRDLAEGTTEEQLREFFDPLGTIGDFFMHRTHRYAFVGFDNPDSVDAALQMTGRELNGAVIQVERKRLGGREAKANGANHRQITLDGKIVVKGIPPNTTDDAIRDFFSSVGEVIDLHINRAKGFAFVGFSGEESCEAALRMDGSEMDGHRLQVERRQRQRCFKCNRDGHVAMQCRVSEVVCRNCGRPGHMARDCRSNAHNDRRREGRFDRREDKYDRREDKYDRREDKYDRREDKYDRREDKYDRREERRRPRSRSNSYDRHRRRSRSRASRSPKRYARHERSRSRSRSRSPVRRRY